MLDKSVPLAEGVLALAVLIALQYVITWLSVRSGWVRSLVKSEPTLLVSDEAYLDNAMREQRVTREEIDAALRDHGVAGIEEVSTAVLETDGSFSVIPGRARKRKSA